MQAHRESVCFFTASGGEHKPHDHDQFRFRRAAFHSQLKSKVVNLIAKAAAMRINLNNDGAPNGPQTDMRFPLILMIPQRYRNHDLKC